MVTQRDSPLQKVSSLDNDLLQPGEEKERRPSDSTSSSVSTGFLGLAPGDLQEMMAQLGDGTPLTRMHTPQLPSSCNGVACSPAVENTIPQFDGPNDVGVLGQTTVHQQPLITTSTPLDVVPRKRSLDPDTTVFPKKGTHCFVSVKLLCSSTLLTIDPCRRR